MNFLFAWRYFKAKKTTNAINIISWISIVAIIIGTASLILVLSVFNGLEGLVKSLYASFYPELKISPLSGKEIILTEQQIQKLRGFNGVKAVSLVVEEKALLQNKTEGIDSTDNQSFINIKGVDDKYSSVTDIAQHIVEGEYKIGDADNPLLVLGAGVQSAVHVQSERNIRPLIIYMPRKSEVNLNDPFKSLSSELVNTSGTFFVQQEFDDKYVITNLKFVKRMLGMGENVYGSAELALNVPGDADRVQKGIQALLGKNYIIQNRFQQNASLYSVMSMEKWFIYAILSLILVVAAFNMVGALTMLVLEKQQDISVLHALGAKRSFILKIFLNEGVLLAIVGGGIGMLLAFTMGLIQLRFHVIPLTGSSFMIDYFPVKMVWTDFLLVGCTIFFIAILASWIPARNASRHQMMLRSE